MIYILYGALGSLGVFALVGVGVLIGWKANNAFRRHSAAVVAEEASEEERRQLIAQQKAFEDMINYNVETAYRMSAELEGDEA